MSEILIARFQHQQSLLVASHIIVEYIILAELIRKYDGYLRIRAKLFNGGLLEYAEFLELDNDGQIRDLKYSFHWQNAENKMVQRWDNAKHHPELLHAPHHIHWAHEIITGNPEIPTLDSVLHIIEQRIT